MSDKKSSDENSFNIEDIKTKKKKKKKNVEIFYENELEIFSPCIDVEGKLCVISDKGDIFRYKLINIQKNQETNDSSSSSSEEEEYVDSNDGESIREKKKKKKEVEEEKYLSIDFTTKCLCSDNDFNFYVFNPITRGLMIIDKNKNIELYTDEYEDKSFTEVNNLVYDKKNNNLYLIDSGNINEENKSSLYYINKDIETMLSIDLENIFYANNICIYQKDNINSIYVCLTKENKILRLIKKGNSYIKSVFLYLNGCYSPLFICSNNTNFVILLKDLSECEKKGKIIEINSNAEIINSFFIKGNKFNGICYDYNINRYFFIEKNIIYIY
ncbi:conserved Plasmodium protein, unknown function [Plasmodium gallinaceum]|uniref:Uncharacterized protein n=1 Tax=Plasmodium gallinaceum TaxID=5849 RepID=A0A1J1H2A4_PLAGA|nr:conserved Plasmodium protein, unknown function [Plasmodium gallinaceum]CRG97462.1 conserved Plasmodium protein, unknown function [Plasmodium gallinaceum]